VVVVVGGAGINRLMVSVRGGVGDPDVGVTMIVSENGVPSGGLRGPRPTIVWA
jgi:hypothetical protein